jgi:glycosyltransferase involved in cell wall biosynthesis
MRIVLTIHHHLEHDAGAPGATLDLGEALSAAGHTVTYLSFDDLPDHVPEQLRMLLFPHLVARRVRALERSGGVDVVDASTGDAWRVRRRPGGPALLTRSHGLEHTSAAQVLEQASRGELALRRRYRLYHGGFRLWEVRRSLVRSDLALFLNARDRDFAVERLGVWPNNARVVANGLPRYFLELPFPFDTNADESSPIRVAWIGSYIQRKGITYGLRALNRVMRAHPSVRVTFAGTGAAAETVLEDFEEDLRQRVTVYPRYRRTDLPKLVQGHEILLFPTLFEGSPVALLEGMALGLAPIASNVPGPQDVIQDGVNGILVPARSPEAITDALERLARDDPVRQQLRRAAHESAQQYDWRHIASDTVELYLGAMRSRNGQVSRFGQ